jgi:hypothetical protein
MGEAKKLFKSQYSDIDAFYLRADLLRPEFGKWDALDPVSHGILDIVEAQHELQNLFSDDVEYGVDNEAAFTAVVKKRHAAGLALMRALENRNNWPDPQMGHRSN